MQKRVLFVAAQHFQVMVAWQLRSTILKDDYVDLILEDGSAGMKTLYERLSKTSFFDKVYFVKKETYKSYSEKIRNAFFRYVFDKKLRYFDEFGFEPEQDYDEVYLNHFTHFATMLIQRLSAEHDVKVYRFEEGYGSYLDGFCYQKKSTAAVFALKNAFAPVLGLPNVVRQIQGDYLFSPERRLFETDRKAYKIPPFGVKNEELRAFLRCAYGDVPDSEFDRKYIFFEENIKDSSIDDFGLVMKIAEKVGKENLMVKLHPRRPVDRFSEHGIKVSKTTGIPWEAILMQYDFSDKTIMTISSGIVFSSRLYLKSNIKTYMLFKVAGSLNPAIPYESRFLNYIDGFRKIHNDGLFFVPENMDEFMSTL